MKKNKNIKAVILAAGEGTRLRPYTLDKPKCLVEVSEQSLLSRQLAVLTAENVTNIVLIGGYRSELLEHRNIELRLNTKYAETNMVWTLFCADNDLEGDVLISYGDIVYSQNILQAILESKADIAVTIDLEWESYWRARNEDPLEDAETLKLDSDGNIYEIGGRPKSLDEIEGQYMGLVKLSQNGINQLREVFNQGKINNGLCGKPIEQAYMTDLLQAVIESGYPIKSVPIKGGWVEVDTVSDLLSETTISRLSVIAETIQR